MKPVPKRSGAWRQKSVELIAAMYVVAETTQPITGRGVGYKLFTMGMIPSMSGPDMQRVYRLLKEARERDMIPWEWIVDETRKLERASSWDNPAEFVDTVSRTYRRDYWSQQAVRVEVASEKGTVRGVLAPVLDNYGVGFRVMHGFSSATSVYDIAQDDDGRPLNILYVGDYDPSGLYMSEHDLPERIAKYGGDHVDITRIALLNEHLEGLPFFAATDKKMDPRYDWFVSRYGRRCWELDALDPNDLRTIVEQAIQDKNEPKAWERCRVVERAERDQCAPF